MSLQHSYRRTRTSTILYVIKAENVAVVMFSDAFFTLPPRTSSVSQHDTALFPFFYNWYIHCVTGSTKYHYKLFFYVCRRTTIDCNVTVSIYGFQASNSASAVHIIPHDTQVMIYGDFYVRTCSIS